jgi:hypothetical protein
MVDRSTIAQRAKHGVGRLGGHTREAARSLLHEKKERVAASADGFADAFRHAGGALDRNRQYRAARYADQAAARIERISAGVRSYDFSDMAASAEGLARRRPALYVAGAVAAGFILTRLLNQPGRRNGPPELGAERERL